MPLMMKMKMTDDNIVKSTKKEEWDPIDSTYDTSTIKVETPDGNMYVHINTKPGTDKVEFVSITIGKAGTSISSWCFAVSTLINTLLSRGESLKSIAYSLSNITSDRSRKVKERYIRSGVDGIVYAFHIYFRYVSTETSKIPQMFLPWLYY